MLGVNIEALDDAMPLDIGKFVSCQVGYDRRQNFGGWRREPYPGDVICELEECSVDEGVFADGAGGEHAGGWLAGV